MRTGLSTIQQTLTQEAASVLNNSIAEAARRNHGQTTPLHVAATLLAAPTGLLRQACVRSHPNSSHPLQCRALELCFSVALDRLPSTSNSQSDSNTSTEPPISNALMAALKRAQAHQRRGCPEQQQSPLLAVKVELEQLVVSILDDPSVSRVMKEASFSSPAVKATIEQSLASASSASSSSPKSPSLNSPSPSAAGLGLGLGTRPATARNLYMNPRLQQQRQGNGGVGGGDTQRKDEVKKVMEILMKTNKKNPVLVGDSDLNAVMKEVLERIERRELGCLVKVISLEKEFASTADKTQIPSKIKELGVLIETQIRSSSSCGVVLDLGDLKWLVESNGEIGGLTGSGPIQQQKVVSEMGRAAVAEMGRIIGRFGEAAGSSGSRVWVIGTATYATYLRCQVYHPTIESEWDLQAVLTAPRSPLSGLFPRVGSNGILSSSVEALAPPKGFQPIKPTPIPLRRPSDSTTDTPQKPSLCSQCMGNYERELAKLVANQFEKSSSDSRLETRPALPQWLQIATAGSTKPSPDQLQTKEHEPNWKQNMEELLKRWRQTCSRLHANSSNPRSFQPKLILSQGFPSLQVANSSDRPISPPGSPVKTDLVLGNPKPLDTSPLEKAHRERIKDFPGCKQDKFSDKRSVKVASFEDSDTLKRLFKGLIEKVGWQPDAASAVTAAVMNSKSGNGKRRGITPKTDTWLLFIGSDKVGKRKMANALSELVFGAGPITVCLGCPRTNGDDGGLSDVNFRGKTSLDRVAEAIRQNPFSVIVLEDIDRADAIVRGTIKQAIERGRLPDSHGREVGLGSAIFVLTADWLPDELKNSQDSLLRLEEKILNSANSGWQLEISVGGKRRLEWLSKDDPAKRRKESNGLSLSLDLNLAAGSSRDDDAGESSRNSSDLTVEHGHEHGRLAIKHSASLSPSLTSELIDSVDDAVVFKPVDFVPLRRRISGSIFAKFASIMGNERLIRIDDDALDRMVGGVWIGGAAFEEWAVRVLVPGIERLRANLKVDDGAAIHLSTVEISGLLQGSAVTGDWLPSKVTVAGDGIREV